ncbi:lipocalin family protein [Flavobacterium facile]|uniref:lipocalin family protein n=1 Tax=Flavobacterium facile TaxID=2893174 RepID=UPI002E78DFAD|nr:lipocalin family protein [Flavobacterium sp. T-12]
MKNRIKLFALILSVGLFTISCNNDDSNQGETLAPLVGKWNLSKVGTTTGGTETLIDAPQNQAGCSKDYIDLKTDNTVIEGDYDSTIDPCALFTDSGIYSRSHNNVTRVVNGVTTVQDIVNLTLNELKLKDASGNIEVFVR